MSKLRNLRMLKYSFLELEINEDCKYGFLNAIYLRNVKYRKKGRN